MHISQIALLSVFTALAAAQPAFREPMVPLEGTVYRSVDDIPPLDEEMQKRSNEPEDFALDEADRRFAEDIAGMAEDIDDLCERINYQNLMLEKSLEEGEAFDSDDTLSKRSTELLAKKKPPVPPRSSLLGRIAPIPKSRFTLLDRFCREKAARTARKVKAGKN